jgi:hypothetical protein
MLPSLQALIVLVAYCAVTILVGYLIVWFIKWMKTPDEPARILTIIVWIIVGVSVVLRLLRFIGLV